MIAKELIAKELIARDLIAPRLAVMYHSRRLQERVGKKIAKTSCLIIPSIYDWQTGFAL